MEQSNNILDALKNFVDQNKTNIQKVKVENPTLHSAVLDTLLFLNKKFGNENITKEEILPEEIVVQQVINTNKPKTIKPFEVGDAFVLSSDKNEIPYYIIIIRAVLKNTIDLDTFEFQGNNCQVPVQRDTYEFIEINNKLDLGEWRIFDIDSIIKAEDVFVEPNSKKEIRRNINIVDKESLEVFYTIDNSSLEVSSSLLWFLKLIKEGEFKKSLIDKQFKVGDIFTVSSDTNEIPNTIITINEIKRNTDVISIEFYDLKDENYSLNPKATDSYTYEQFTDKLNNGIWKIVNLESIIRNEDLFDEINTTSKDKIQRLVTDVDLNRFEVFYTAFFSDGKTNDSENSLILFLRLIKDGILVKARQGFKYENGDLFRTDLLPNVIIRLTNIDYTVKNATIQLYKTDELSLFNPPYDTTNYDFSEIEELIDNGTWIKIELSDIVKVGDIFINDYEKNIVPTTLNKILNINAAKNKVLLIFEYLNSNKPNKFSSTTLIDWLILIKNNNKLKYTPNQNILTTSTTTPQNTILKVGDWFTLGIYNEKIPDTIIFLREINESDETITVDFFDLLDNNNSLSSIWEKYTIFSIKNRLEIGEWKYFDINPIISEGDIFYDNIGGNLPTKLIDAVDKEKNIIKFTAIFENKKETDFSSSINLFLRRIKDGDFAKSSSIKDIKIGDLFYSFYLKNQTIPHLLTRIREVYSLNGHDFVVMEDYNLDVDRDSAIQTETLLKSDFVDSYLATKSINFLVKFDLDKIVKKGDYFKVKNFNPPSSAIYTILDVNLETKNIVYNYTTNVSNLDNEINSDISTFEFLYLIKTDSLEKIQSNLNVVGELEVGTILKDSGDLEEIPQYLKRVIEIDTTENKIKFENSSGKELPYHVATFSIGYIKDKVEDVDLIQIDVSKIINVGDKFITYAEDISNPKEVAEIYEINQKDNIVRLINNNILNPSENELKEYNLRHFLDALRLKELVKYTPNITAQIPISPLETTWEVGDFFIREADAFILIPDIILKVDGANSGTDKVFLEEYLTDYIDYIPNGSIMYKFGYFNSLISSGELIKINLSEIIKVGDVFVDKANNNKNPRTLSYINEISTIYNNITVTEKYPNTNIPDLTNQKWNLYNTIVAIKLGDLFKITPTTQVQIPPFVATTTSNLTFQEGDIFVNANVQGVPEIVYQIIRVRTDVYTIESTNFELDETKASDEFKKDFINDVNNGKYVRYIPFKVGDVLIENLFGNKTVIEVEEISQSDLYSTDIDEDGVKIKGSWDIVGLIRYMYNGVLTIENKVNLPITPTLSTSTLLNYKVGDKFRMGYDENNPPLYIFEIISIDSNDVFYNRLNTNTQKLSSDFRNISWWNDELIKGKFVPYVQPVTLSAKTYKVGDKFVLNFSKVNPSYIYTITEINTVSNTITYEILTTSNNDIESITETIDSWDSEFDNLKPYQVSTTIATTDIKVGDLYVLDDTVDFPQLVFKIIDEKYSVFRIESTDLDTDKTKTSFAAKIDLAQDINDGKYKKYVPLKIGDVLIDSSFTTPLKMQVVRIVNDLIYTKNTDEQLNEYDAEYSIVDLLQLIYKGVIVPLVTINYKVGDKFKDANDAKIPPSFIYTINEIDTDYDFVYYDLFQRNTKKRNRFGDTKIEWEDKLTNGELVPYVEPTTVTPKVTKKSKYEVGDKFTWVSDPNVPPSYIYEITKIDKYDVTYNRIDTKTKQSISYIETKKEWNRDFKNNKWIPYVEPKTVTPTTKTKATSTKAISTPAKPTKTTPTKAKSASTPIKAKAASPKPKPTPTTPKAKAKPPVASLTCKEIKDAIKGYQLLISLGDNSVKKELNDLKQLAKTQNCK